MSDEKRLITTLLNQYEKVGIVGRPVYNTSETVRVNYGLALIQILDLDEKNQVLTTNVWSRYSWTDILLRWNPEDYGGVDEVRIPVGKIWKPDIVLYNYADERLKEHRDIMTVVSKDGSVMWIPPAIFKSTCSINIVYFPFDEQTCKMKFGSWTYDGYKVDLDFYYGLDAVDMSDYTRSNEWKVLAHPAIRHVKRYPCCDEPFIDLTFTLKLRRTSAFYTYILILPCVLLSILVLVVFWLPPESPAKTILGMNIFIAFFLLLQILADSTPPASESVPLIGIYFCLNMVLITLSTFLSVIVINLYFRSDKKRRIPKLLRMVMVDGLARLFCIRSAFYPEENAPKKVVHTTTCSADGHAHGHRKNSKEKRKIKSPVLQYNKWEPPSANHTSESPLATRCHTPERTATWNDQVLENDVRDIRKSLRGAMNRLMEKDSQTKIAMEWRMVALALDRLFFFIYFTTIAVSLGTIFPHDIDYQQAPP